MNDKNKTTEKDQVPAPSVKDRLSALMGHKRELQNQAQTIGAAGDPIEAARKLAALSSELQAVAIVEQQLEGQLSADETVIEQRRRAKLDAQIALIRPRESNAFRGVVAKALELQAAIDALAGVEFELSSFGAGAFVPGAGDLGCAIEAARGMWSMYTLGRECLSMPAEPSAKERAIAEARERVKRAHAALDVARAASVSNESENDKCRRVKELEAALASVMLDLDVLLGKREYPKPKVIDLANMTDLQRADYVESLRD
jgi:hypothetical protein